MKGTLHTCYFAKADSAQKKATSLAPKEKGKVIAFTLSINLSIKGQAEKNERRKAMSRM